MIYYISDLHFHHANIIQFDGRPFQDVKQMNEKLISNWNNRVKATDEVYIVGDIGITKDMDALDSCMSRLAGKKHLVLGNHDRKMYRKHPELFDRWFESVSEYKEIMDSYNRVILCHFPILFYTQSYKESHYMLYGHVHVKNEAIQCKQFIKSLRDHFKKVGPDVHANRGQIYNVGCMEPYMDYTPQPLSHIIKH